MDERTCTMCGETFPATTDHFHKHGTRKDGSVKLAARCKACVSKKKDEYYVENKNHILDRAAEYRSKPEVKARKKAYDAEYNTQPENKTRKKAYNAALWKAQRLAEGKELGVKTPPTNFYIGYVVLESGTYFKPGITSYDSMQERYEKDPKYSDQLIGVQQTDFWRFDTEDEARAMESEFLSHCQTFMGEPTMGREWWKVQ